MPKLTVLMMAALLSINPALAAEPHHGHVHGSPYAGEETREIKSLSQTDVDELLRGGGWGLAKAAELNGMPGPSHVLDMASELSLSAEQVERTRVAEIESIRAKLRTAHLSAHIEMTRVLSAEQVRRYATLRGYRVQVGRAVPGPPHPKSGGSVGRGIAGFVEGRTDRAGIGLGLHGCLALAQVDIGDSRRVGRLDMR